MLWVAPEDRDNDRNAGGVQWLRLSAFTAVGLGSVPGRGTKNPQAAWHGQKKKKRNAGGHKPGVRLFYPHLTTILLPTVLEIVFT